MNREHKHYEIQSGLAAVGQLTEAELADLEHHAATCTSCRNHLSDMARISRICFLMHASKAKEYAPEGMLERFIERAGHAGIRIGNPNSGLLPFRSLRLAVIAFLLCIAASFGWKTFHVRTTRPGSISATSLGFIQPGIAVQPIDPTLWAQPVSIMSTKVTQLNTKPSARHVLPTTTGKLKRPTIHFEPNVEPNVEAITPQGSRSFASHGSPDWFRPAPAILYDRARFTPTSNLLPDAGFLTCIKHADDCRAGVRSFRMDPKLMSLAYLETPGSPYGGTTRTALKFAAPEFHLRSTRSW